MKGYYFFRNYLEDSERILDVAHKHILVLKVKTAKVSFFGIFVPVLFYLMFPKLLLIVIVWLIIGGCAMLYYFIDWYFDVLILTKVGVIGVSKDGLFEVTATRVEYHMIEGISYTIKGFWHMLFNFGDIIIDKMGAKTSVVLHDAANPKKLERKIMKYQEEFVAEKSIRDHQELKGMLANMIAYHVQNKKIKSPRDQQ